MIKAAIIEDNSVAAEVLNKLIKENCTNIHIVAVYSSGNEALLKLTKIDCELLFLDINLGDMTAFDLLGLLPKNKYQIIFTTSYSEYAVTAFKANAIDYLMKPVTGKELLMAVNKANEKIKSNSSWLDILDNYPQQKSDRLMIYRI